MSPGFYPHSKPAPFGESRPEGLFTGAALFCLGLVCFWEIRLFGTLTLTEIFLLGLAGFYLKDLAYLFTGKIARTLMVLAALWLVSQVVTDIYRGTPFRDWSRGWGRIIIWVANFSVFYHWLRTNVGRAAWLVWGFVAGLTISALLKMEYFTAIMLWKFGLGLPALFACGVFFSRWPRSFFYVLALLSLAAVGVVLSFRSYSGLCLVGAALWVLWRMLDGRERPFAVKKTAWWLAGVSGAVLVAGVFIYSSLALNNAFGSDERFRTQQQMRRGIGFLGDNPLAEPLGLIAGARGEFLVALRAVSDSPVLGHGSWAKNPFYTDLWVSVAGESKITEVRMVQVEAAEPGLIPSHSHVLGAWVDAGFLGGVFWIYVLGLSYATLALVLCTRQPLTAFILPVFALFIWDIFFSPLSTQSRLFSALYVALSAVLLERHRLRLAVTQNLSMMQPAPMPGAAGAEKMLRP